MGIIIFSGTPASAVAPEMASSSPIVAVTTTIAMERPAGPENYAVKLTSYNAVPGQTDDTPFTTSIGADSNPQVVAARSSDLSKKLPYGTIIAVEAPEDSDTPNCHFDSVDHLIGYRVIADAMNSRIVNTVDVLFDAEDTVTVGTKEMNPSRALGLCKGVNVRVIGWIDPKKIPATQKGLVKIIKAAELASVAK